MERLIDTSNIRVKPQYMQDVMGIAMIRCEDLSRILADVPTVEAIPKADYETRLTTDMATIKQLSNSVKALRKANLEIAGAYDKLKADYEAKLKADMLAMLTGLLLEIEQCGVEDSHCIIKEKINDLKGKEDGKDK